MAVNIVTGMTGIEHITSHDDRARNASQFGRGKYVLDIGRKFSATAVDDNLVRIQDGMCINQGTQMGIEPNDYTDVEIDNGLLGTNRHDIIVMRYEKNEETLLEKASLAVVKGVNSSEPVDPGVTEGNILDGGDLVDDMPLYRVVIEGVNLVSVEPLFEVFDGDIGSVLEELDNKVDKVTGKGLSTNDYTNTDKTKLDGIETGAEANVQADWSQNDDTADDFIKHKPSIPSKTSDLQNDSNFVTDASYTHTDNNYTDTDKEDVAKIDNLEHSLSTTSTATGNPISISDSAHVNAEELKVELEPIQDLHGYDKPWVGGAGKNLLEVTATSQTINGVTFTVNSDGTVIANGTATEEADFILTGASSIQGSYIANGCPTGGSTSTYYLAVETSGSIWNSRDVGDGVTINDDTIIRAAVVIVGGYTANNLVFKPMIRLATETDSTFEPYSNICPISGYDETSVVRSNYVDLVNSELVNGYYAGIDGEFHPVNSGYVATSEPIDIVSGGMYTVSSGRSGTDGAVVFYDSNGNYLNNAIIPLTTKVLSFTTPLNASKCAITVGAGDSGITIDNVGYIHLVQGIEPYTADTYTLQFGDTVYGAEVDFVRGVARVKTIQSVITGMVEGGNVGANGLYIGIVAGNAKPSANNSAGNIISDKLQTVTADYQWVDTNNSVSINDIGYVQVCIENITSNSDLNTYLASNPVQICYELATPYTIQLTPQQIKMLKGNNVLVADGDMDLVYQVDSVVGDVKEWAENEFLPKASATAQHNYSTQEQVVGTWIDGSALYEKTYICACDNTSNVQAVISFTDERVKIVSDAYFMNSLGHQIRIWWGGTLFWDYVITNDAVSVKRETSESDWQSDVTFVVTIQYTKTTD